MRLKPLNRGNIFSKQARAETFRELRHLQVKRPMCTIERLPRGIRALKWYAKSLARRGETFETKAVGHIDKALRL